MLTLHRTPSLPRLSASLLLTLLASLLLAFLTATPASAQADPPGRVARLSYTSGNLSFAPAGSEQWVVADLNRPLTSGDSLWVPAAARAELHVGENAVRLNQNTSLNFLALSDDTVQLKLTRGTMLVRLRSLSGKEVFEIDTPNLAFSLQEPGEYRIDVNDDNTSTVTVRRGTGIAYGEHDSVTIREAEQARFAGTNLSELSIGRMPPYDSFELWANQRDRAEDTSVSARYVSREVIGYQQLDAYGSWETDAEYGAIWLPRQIEIGWAPYRNGNWLWIAPWGWTWVDRAPWGFAPYHYGRWAHIGPRWAWVPGPHLHHDKPVYAPALVAFVGAGERGFNPNGNNHAGRAHSPTVAWFPLAPGEAYHPSYTSSSNYLTRLNRDLPMHDRQNRHDQQGQQSQQDRPQRYQNQHISNAVTAVPAASFARGHFVAANATPLSPQQIRNAQIGTAAPALAPSRESLFGAAKHVAAPDHSQFIPRQQFRPNSGVNNSANNPANKAADDAARYRADARARFGAAAPVISAPAMPAAPATAVTPGVVPRNPIHVENPQRNLRSEEVRPAARREAEQNQPQNQLQNQPQFERPRGLPQPPAPARIEERREAPANHGFNSVQQDNANPAARTRREERGAERAAERSAERPIAAPREMARPAETPAPQVPRAERQPNFETHREAAPNPARTEREREHKEKPEPRNTGRNRED